MSALKGQGNRINNSLTAEKKVKLTLWVAALEKKDERSYDVLSTTASAELGFTVTSHNISYMWQAVHGNRNGSKRNDSKSKEIESRIEELERKYEKLILKLECLL